VTASPVGTVPNVPSGIPGIVPDRFRLDPESVCSPGINLPADWKVLSLLIGAKAGSGPETKDAIHLASVVSFVAQSFLQVPDLAPVLNRRYFSAGAGSRSKGLRARSGDPRRHRYEDNRSPR